MIKQFFISVLKWVVTAMLLVMTSVTFAQIISRYFLQYPLVWSEELSLLLMVWITFLGSVLILERQEHISIDALVEYFSESVQDTVRVIGYLLVLIFNAVLTYGGFLMVSTTKESITSALKISVAWQYGGILVGGLCLTLVSLEQLIKALQMLRQTRGSHK